MSYDPKDPYGTAHMPKRPGNFGGETFRQWCGLSRRRARNRWGFTERGMTAQDVFRAIVAHGGPK